MKILPFFLALVLLVPLAATAETSAEPPRFRVDYRVEFLPDDGTARVSIHLQADQARVSRLAFNMPESRYSGVRGDGETHREGRYLHWQPPETGGTLHYVYRIDKVRKNGAWDARITPDWVIVRGDGLVPPARVTATRGARSSATLQLKLPAGWTHAETPWRRTADRSGYRVVNEHHVLARPTGWIIAGDIGTRRDRIEATEYVIAAPKGEATTRMDLLAMLTATTPVMLDAFDTLPEKLLVVRAGDPMWRGGLSGPRSLWLHAERPLISENGTSPLMHEVVHVVTRIRGAAGDDWIAEGIAEYYGAELLRRAGLLSQARFDKSMAWMQRHGKPIRTLHAAESSGRRTARAVVLFHELDAEIRKQSRGARNLDSVTRALMRDGQRVSLEDLREAAEDALGRPSKVLQSRLLD